MLPVLFRIHPGDDDEGLTANIICTMIGRACGLTVFVVGYRWCLLTSIFHATFFSPYASCIVSFSCVYPQVHLDPDSLSDIVPLDYRSVSSPPPSPLPRQAPLPPAVPPSVSPSVANSAPPPVTAPPSLAVLLAPPTASSAPSPLAAQGFSRIAGPLGGGGGQADNAAGMGVEVEVDVSSVTGVLSVGVAPPQVVHAAAAEVAGAQVSHSRFLGIQQQHYVEMEVEVDQVMDPPPPRDTATVAVPEQAPQPLPEREIACMYCRSSQGALLDCGVTETGVGPGRCRRHREQTTATEGCCGDGGGVGGGGCSSRNNNNSQSSVCHRRFHFLCGWFAGAYVKLSNADHSFTRGARDVTGRMDRWPVRGEPKHGFPAGMLVEIRCLDHSKGPGGRGELGTTVEAQAKLRGKYRLKVGVFHAGPCVLNVCWHMVPVVGWAGCLYCRSEVGISCIFCAPGATKLNSVHAQLVGSLFLCSLSRR